MKLEEVKRGRQGKKNSSRFLSTSLWLDVRERWRYKKKNDGMRSQEEEVGMTGRSRKEGGIQTCAGVDAGRGGAPAEDRMEG